MRVGLRGFDDDAATPAAKVLTTSFAYSGDGVTDKPVCDDSGAPIYAPDDATTALVTVTATGTLMTTLHLQLVPSPDGVVKRGPLPTIDSNVSGAVTYFDASHEKAAPAVSPTQHSFPIRIIPGMYYFIMAKRTGGDATSKIIAIVDFC